jgi:glycosyltransferase involved in cell wall biosynthesis
MDKRVNGLKVALVGSYPPGYGGIAIHIQRLQAECLNDNIQCTVFNTNLYVKRVEYVLNLRRVREWPRILISAQDIIHVHTTSMHWRIPALLFCLSRLKRAKYMITYHSLRYSAQDFSLLGRMMMRVILKSASHCIVTNSEIKEKLISLGARPERISIIPAFLPPVKKDEEIAEIPQQVWDFMDSHTPVISANAFTIIFYGGQDLYGIDMCVELCARLKSDYPRVGFVFCLPDIRDYDYFNELKRRITEKGVENNFLFQTEPCQFYPIMMKSDIFARPTISDGDAISLREALYLKVPSVASDVVPRPGGTVLFKNRDVDDFIARVKMVWENYSYYKSEMESLEMENGLSKILGIYRSLASQSKVSHSG